MQQWDGDQEVQEAEFRDFLPSSNADKVSDAPVPQPIVNKGKNQVIHISDHPIPQLRLDASEDNAEEMPIERDKIDDFDKKDAVDPILRLFNQVEERPQSLAQMSGTTPNADSSAGLINTSQSNNFEIDYEAIREEAEKIKRQMQIDAK